MIADVWIVYQNTRVFSRFKAFPISKTTHIE